MPIREILVPTDFSPDASQALDQAIELARQHASKLHLLHSYHVMDTAAALDPQLLPPDFIETLRAGAQQELELLQKRVAQSGIPCELHLSPLPALSAILDVAQAIPADLIAMGTRGLTGLTHVLLGSVAERTVRLAPCPVLTVKAPAA